MKSKIGFWILALAIMGVAFISGCVQQGKPVCPPAGFPQPPGCEGGQKIYIPQMQVAGNPPVSEINLSTAVVVPTDIFKINYPNFYSNPSTKAVIVKNPYCIIAEENVAYPADYLGNRTFPEISGAPLPAEIKKAVGLKDMWTPWGPNLNNCASESGYGSTREALEKSLPRVKALGAEQIHITNYVSFSNFQKAEVEDFSKAAMPDDDLRFIAKKASEQGLGVVLYLNLAPGKETVSEIPNDEWLSTLIKNWKPFVLHEARLAQETGIKAIMINHFDYQPAIKGYEETYQKEMLDLIKEVRVVYNGRIILLIEPLGGANLDKLANLLDEADIFLYTPYTKINDEADKTVSVSNLRSIYAKRLAEIGKYYGKYNKPVYLRVLIQSEAEFLEKGWNEDMFCIQRGNDPCYQKNLKVDFSLQAIAYEALMEAIKQVHGKEISFGAVDTYGYWFTDTIFPYVSQPQMAHSVRNKPAESIVRAWFRK